MNRIYRRIWNAVRQCWVVASELSRSRGKGTQRRRSLGAAVSTALLCTGLVASAEPLTECGDKPEPCESESYEWMQHSLQPNFMIHSVTGIGTRAIHDTVYGDANTYSGNYNAVFGRVAQAKGLGTAVGYAAGALGNGATAVGSDAYARSAGSIAIGRSAGTYSTVAEGAIAIGYNASVNSSSDPGGIAVGARSMASYDSVALGYKATALGAWSVALGSESRSSEHGVVTVGNEILKRRIVNVYDGRIDSGSTDAVNGKQLYAAQAGITAAQSRADAAYSNASAAQSTANTAQSRADSALGKANTLGALLSQTAINGDVRIGIGNSGTALNVRNSSNGTRKITGVTEGTLSSSSTDAVTGKQLFNTHAVATGAKTAADAAAAQVKASSYLLVNGTVGSDTNKAKATGTGALANGVSTEASGTAATAMGRTAKALAEGAIAIGDRAGVESVTSKHSIAIGTMAKTGPQEDLLAIGRNANASGGVGAMALGYGSTASHLRSVALGSGSTTSAQDQVSVGSTGIKRKIVNVANGNVTSTSNEAVTGAQLFSTDKLARDAQTGASSALSKAVALEGLIKQVGAAGDIRMGSENTGTVLDVRNKNDAKRKISGLADASLSSGSSEAVNGAQLNRTNTEVAEAKLAIDDAVNRLMDVENSTRHVAIGTPINDEKAKAGRLGIAMGDSAVAAPSKDGAVALGSFSRAEGEDSVTLGRAAWVQDAASRGFALGSRSVVAEIEGVALGAGAEVAKGAQNAVAVGAGSIALESLTVSMGDGALQRRITNVARGTSEHNASTVGQLNDALATLGGGAKLDANGSVIAPTYTVQNTRQRTVGDALTVLDNAVVRSTSRMDGVEGELRSIFQERVGVQSNGINTVALAGLNGALLTNLADGRIAAGSRDAVTGNQLFAAEQKIEQNRGELDALQRDRNSEQLRAFAGSHVGNPIDFGGARLTGVADARLSADSSDVVRGSQLFATNADVQQALRGVLDTEKRVATIESTGRRIAIGAPLDDGKAQAGRLGIALGDSAYAALDKDGATALGSYSRAEGTSSVALGRAAWVQHDADYGFAVGVESVVEEEFGIAIGHGSKVQKGARNAVAIGIGSRASESQTVSFGQEGLQRRLTNVARGTDSHNAATVGQLRGALSGFGAEVDSDGNIVGPQFSVQGGTQSTLNDALTTLDGAVLRTTSRVDGMEGQLRSIFQDTATARADGFNQLTLAGAQGMVISNVANGLVAAGSREAVNGGQLHAVQQQLNGRIDGLEQRVDGQGPAPQSRAMALASSEQEAAAPTPPATQDDKVVADTGNAPKSSPAPQPKAEAPESPKPQVDTAELEKMLARANDYSDGIAREVDARLNKMDKRFNRMAAMSSAQTAMAMNTAGLATYNRLGAGVGYAEGESAMAVGYQRVLNDKGSATFSLNGAFTNSGERSVGVGVGIGW